MVKNVAFLTIVQLPNNDGGGRRRCSPDFNDHHCIGIALLPAEASPAIFAFPLPGERERVSRFCRHSALLRIHLQLAFHVAKDGSLR